MKIFSTSCLATLTLCMTAMVSCNNAVTTPKQDLTLSGYFKPTGPGVQTGGVKMVTIETPMGKFNMWKKNLVITPP